MNYSYALHEEAFEEYTQALEWYEGRGQAERYRTQIKKRSLPFGTILLPGR